METKKYLHTCLILLGFVLTLGLIISCSSATGNQTEVCNITDDEGNVIEQIPCEEFDRGIDDGLIIPL